MTVKAKVEVRCRRCREEVCKDVEGTVHTECMCVLYQERPADIEMEGAEGRVYCRCKAVIGRFKWHGTKCLCGQWNTPFISIHLSRVDCVQGPEWVGS